jgi:hypothetical protein
MIPHADQIRTFQAPSIDKLIGRCNKVWGRLLGEQRKMLGREQHHLDIPIMGETDEMVQEVIKMLEEKDLGYKYSREPLLPVPEEANCSGDSWVTGYLRFSW